MIEAAIVALAIAVSLYQASMEKKAMSYGLEELLSRLKSLPDCYREVREKVMKYPPTPGNPNPDTYEVVRKVPICGDAFEDVDMVVLTLGNLIAFLVYTIAMVIPTLILSLFLPLHPGAILLVLLVLFLKPYLNLIMESFMECYYCYLKGEA